MSRRDESDWFGKVLCGALTGILVIMIVIMAKSCSDVQNKISYKEIKGEAPPVETVEQFDQRTAALLAENDVGRWTRRRTDALLALRKAELEYEAILADVSGQYGVSNKTIEAKQEEVLRLYLRCLARNKDKYMGACK